MNPDAIVHVAKRARLLGPDFPGPLSTGEAVTAALVLNRPDWLKKMGYTIAEAVRRVDASTVANLFDAQLVLQNEAPLVEG